MRSYASWSERRSFWPLWKGRRFSKWRKSWASRFTVDKWRRRFSLFGLRGLWDQPRSGKPAKYDADFRNRVLALLEQPPPPHLSHWDGPAIAERLEASVYAVWRVLRR